MTILLRSSLLRRRASFAPAGAVLAMSVVMASFMSLSSMLTTGLDLILVGAGLVILFGIIGLILIKK